MCRTRRDLEEEGRFSDTGLAAEQDRGTWDDAAAENTVEFGDAARPVPHGFRRDVGDRSSGPVDADRDGFQGTQHSCWRNGLGDGSPFLAFTATTGPLGRRPTAFRAAVVQLRLRHTSSSVRPRQIWTSPLYGRPLSSSAKRPGLW